MSSRSKYLDTVLKLNRQTQDGKVKWKRRLAKEHNGLAGGFSEREEYVTEQKEKRFVIREKSASENRSRRERMADALLAESRGYAQAVLEIRDPSGETLFRFPHMSAIDDLYETVYTGRTDEVDAFLEEFLSEE